MVSVVDSYRRQWRREAKVIATGAVAVLVLAACQARPGDAPIADEPTTTQSSPVVAPDKADRTITIGVSEFSAGFNPHLISTDPSFATVVADLILPSAFRENDQGQLQLDTDLLESAEPSETDAGAQKVRYVIRPEAQWSDGTPISGSDFEYLWQAMRQNVGVRDAAGYEAIKDLHVSNGGRVVDVTFADAYPNWRTLFDHLLPSHIYRSSGISFIDAMDESIPVSGGRYTVQSLDIGRNDLVLVRNDRFSGESPAATEILKFREVTSDQQGAELLRTSQAQLVSVRPKEVSETALGSVPQVTAQTTNPPAQLQLDFNLASTQLHSPADRSAIADVLNVPTIAQIVTGRSQQPPKFKPEADSAKGEDTDSAEQSPTPQMGRPLRIGYPDGDADAQAAAATIADQLNNANIKAQAIGAQRRELFAGYLPAGSIDMAVTWQWQPDSLASLTGQYLCTSHTRQAVEVDQPTESSSTSGPNQTKTEAPETKATSEPTTKAADTFGRGSNISGLCDPAVDKLLLDAMHAGTDSAELKKQLDPVLAKEVVTVPLVADQWLTAVGSGVASGSEQDPKKWPQHAQTGLFVTAPTWKRTTDG